MSDPTTTPGRIGGAELRKLRGRAQRLEAVTRLGKGGVSPEFLAGLDRELALHELVKVRFYELKDQRHEVAEQLARHFPGKVFETVIPRNIRLAEAPSHGTAALQYDRNSSGTRAYLALADELIARHRPAGVAA